MRSVTSMRGRPSSASGIDLEAGDPLALDVPRRADAEQGERLGDVVALRPHRRRAPQHEPDRVGMRAGLGEVALDEPSASATPTSHASGDGIAFGSTE